MNKWFEFLALALLSSLSQAAPAALNVFACEPEWGALAWELGGDKVSVYSATTALQDAHHIEARPSLIAKARSADLLICTGAELEIGWLPLLLTQSGNGKIQPGTPGYLEASNFVLKLEVPKLLDRAQGDIHPAGNPHIDLDPRNIARVAEVITDRLSQLDSVNTATYQARGKAFQERWQAAIQRWEQEGAPLKGLPVITHHKDMTYLIHWLGMREVGNLEPKPGLPPTAGHLAELFSNMQRDPAKMILRTPFQDTRPSESLASRAKIPAVVLPFTVGGSDKAKDLFGLFDDTIQRLLQAAK
ncbi:MAG TPA: zinc ABC transporter substrate-binding protein [Burkholderiales bacterium]|nr:zinc ABC transporter substrate-binding protein [Burkholderiales bacterium]